MPDASDLPADAADVARELAAALELRGHEYALGGAIALAFWGEPRATVDVDLTLFVAPGVPATCIRLLQEVGCEVDPAQTQRMIEEHGFCRVQYRGTRVDVFLPTLPFYDIAKQRRARVELGDTSVSVWRPEVLAVFKMMFFRTRDLADVEQMLRVQATGLDRAWVQERLLEIYGSRDPRVSRWTELCNQVDSET